MTTQNQAREAIYEAFVSAWGATTALTLDNEEFDPPDGAAWARLSVRHSAAAQETLGPAGSRRFERQGSVLVQIFVPTDTGTQSMDSLATQARNVFEGVRLVGTTVRFSEVIVRETGPDRERKWYQTVVEAPFQYDETK